MTPEIIVNIDTDVGENPLWYKKENSLLRCDIPHIRHKEGFIYSYQEYTGKYSTLYRGRPVGGFTLQEDDSLVLFMDKGAIAILDKLAVRAAFFKSIRELLNYLDFIFLRIAA